MNHWLIFALGIVVGIIVDAAILGLALALFKGAAVSDDRWIVDARELPY